jgi:hypothetical protein
MRYITFSIIIPLLLLSNSVSLYAEDAVDMQKGFVELSREEAQKIEAQIVAEIAQQYTSERVAKEAAAGYTSDTIAKRIGKQREEELKLLSSVPGYTRDTMQEIEDKAQEEAEADLQRQILDDLAIE